MRHLQNEKDHINTSDQDLFSILHSDIKAHLKNENVTMVGHFFTTGPGEELEKYLSTRVKSLIFISHPFHFSGRERTLLKEYADGSLVSKKSLGSAKRSSSLTFLKDVLSTILYFLRTGRKYDLFIGIGGLNAFSGLVLRRLGITKRVIFYVIDYAPARFKNRLLNRLYHWIDKECVTKCDLVWNLSEEMKNERQRRGIANTAPQLVVPIGTNFNSINRMDFSQIDRFTIAYLGILLKDMGVQLVIEAFAELQQLYPHARLVIIGRGEYMEQLRELASSLGVESKVNFTGEIKSHADVESVLVRCGIGMAPYVPSTDSFKAYTDPGKVKTYMACGLPVILTGVPKIAREIKIREAGIVVEYDKEDLAKAIARLFDDESLHRKMRENAISFASQFEWEKIFDEAFKNFVALVQIPNTDRL